jgi:hypothetical protein
LINRNAAADPEEPPMRSRWSYLALTVAVVGLGLGLRHTGVLPPRLGKYVGDALYALMTFCAVAALFPRWPTARVAALALGWCVAVEFGQLYHAPWIDSIRATTLGHLVLGTHFGWWDLLAYAAGVLVGTAVDHVLDRGPKH